MNKYKRKEIKKYKKGLLVWAKLRGYPQWPGKITARKGIILKGQQYLVFFFGSNDVGIISEKNIEPHSQVLVLKNKMKKRQSATYRKAIEEIVRLDKNSCSGKCGAVDIRKRVSNETVATNKTVKNDYIEEKPVIQKDVCMEKGLASVACIEEKEHLQVKSYLPDEKKLPIKKRKITNQLYFAEIPIKEEVFDDEYPDYLNKAVESTALSNSSSQKNCFDKVTSDSHKIKVLSDKKLKETTINAEQSHFGRKNDLASENVGSIEKVGCAEKNILQIKNYLAQDPIKEMSFRKPNPSENSNSCNKTVCNKTDIFKSTEMPRRKKAGCRKSNKKSSESKKKQTTKKSLLNKDFDNIMSSEDINNKSKNFIALLSPNEVSFIEKEVKTEKDDIDFSALPPIVTLNIKRELLDGITHPEPVLEDDFVSKVQDDICVPSTLKRSEDRKTCEVNISNRDPTGEKSFEQNFSRIAIDCKKATSKKTNVFKQTRSPQKKKVRSRLTKKKTTVKKSCLNKDITGIVCSENVYIKQEKEDSVEFPVFPKDVPFFKEKIMDKTIPEENSVLKSKNDCVPLAVKCIEDEFEAVSCNKDLMKEKSFEQNLSETTTDCKKTSVSKQTELLSVEKLNIKTEKADVMEFSALPPNVALGIKRELLDEVFNEENRDSRCHYNLRKYNLLFNGVKEEGKKNINLKKIKPVKTGIETCASKRKKAAKKKGSPRKGKMPLNKAFLNEDFKNAVSADEQINFVQDDFLAIQNPAINAEKIFFSKNLPSRQKKNSKSKNISIEANNCAKAQFVCNETSKKRKFTADDDMKKISAFENIPAKENSEQVENFPKKENWSEASEFFNKLSLIKKSEMFNRCQNHSDRDSKNDLTAVKQMNNEVEKGVSEEKHIFKIPAIPKLVPGHVGKIDVLRKETISEKGLALSSKLDAMNETIPKKESSPKNEIDVKRFPQHFSKTGSAKPKVPTENADSKKILKNLNSSKTALNQDYSKSVSVDNKMISMEKETFEDFSILSKESQRSVAIKKKTSDYETLELNKKDTEIYVPYPKRSFCTSELKAENFFRRGRDGCRLKKRYIVMKLKGSDKHILQVPEYENSSEVKNYASLEKKVCTEALTKNNHSKKEVNITPEIGYAEKASILKTALRKPSEINKKMVDEKKNPIIAAEASTSNDAVKFLKYKVTYGEAPAGNIPILKITKPPSLDNVPKKKSNFKNHKAEYFEEYQTLIRNLPPNYTELSENIMAFTAEMKSANPQNSLSVLKAIDPVHKKIGFLGVGDLGERIIRNLLNAGHSVMLWNRTISKCNMFVNCKIAKTPADVVTHCDIIFSCLKNDYASKEVFFGLNGVNNGFKILSKKSVKHDVGYIELSTISPETSVDINKAVISNGGRFLDAKLMAKDTKDICSFVLISGDNTLYDECKSCFQSIVNHTLYLGRVPNSTKFNIVLSTVYASIIFSLRENLELMRCIGINPQDYLNILSASNFSFSDFIREGYNIINRDAENTVNRSIPNMEHAVKWAKNAYHGIPNSRGSPDSEALIMPITTASMKVFERNKYFANNAVCSKNCNHDDETLNCDKTEKKGL